MSGNKSREFSINKLRTVMDSVINTGGEFKMISRGTSMLPMLRDGVDTVVVVKANTPLKIGDVPLYIRENGEYVLHRIIKVRKDGYVLRGDNQTVSEYPICENQIVGVLTAYIKDGKRIECTDLKYRIYAFYVVHFMYFRLFYKKSMRFARRIFGKMKRVIKRIFLAERK